MCSCKLLIVDQIATISFMTGIILWFWKKEVEAADLIIFCFALSTWYFKHRNCKKILFHGSKGKGNEGTIA
uniref:BEACH domain-containing protein lvsC isoform X3 n=1 Tax=Rhizophora mucronata TaxID=61149 RepID=A0A2P2MSN4_RHIMU